ncbi:MAG: HAD hydrolase family protein, partial [Mycoplasmataceae bacterium]|nr:HAD hydrolase family protein [Mycoplasmataceae bacterium]
IAMGNAIPGVKAVADEIIGDNDSDAIEKRLIELMKNNSN